MVGQKLIPERSKNEGRKGNRSSISRIYFRYLTTKKRSWGNSLKASGLRKDFNRIRVRNLILECVEGFREKIKDIRSGTKMTNNGITSWSKKKGI